MNPRLAAVADEALGQLGDDRVGDWTRVLVVKNEGPVAGPIAEGDGNRGFNVLLLSPEGRPAYYLRCRAAADSAATREAAVLQRLAANPTIAASLPALGTATGEGVRVLATRFVNGTLLARELPGQPAALWRTALLEILNLVRAAGRAECDLPGEGHDTVWNLLGRARPSLTRLGESGVEASQLRAIEGLLRDGGTLAWSPQHGDLWPGNVIRRDGGWTLLDFEHFGLVGCPMYDACHLVHTGMDYVVAGGHGLRVPLSDLLGRDPALAGGVHRVLRAEAEAYALTGPEAAGALAFHLVDITARLLGNGAEASVTAPLLRELAAMADTAAWHDVAGRWLGGPLPARR